MSSKTRPGDSYWVFILLVAVSVSSIILTNNCVLSLDFHPGGTPLYLLYGYVPRYRVWFFGFLVWRRVSFFDILSGIG